MVGLQYQGWLSTDLRLTSNIARPTLCRLPPKQVHTGRWPLGNRLQEQFG
jgi:hypothetical protein